jgi:23S rRNA (guanosine2251-2'-O)-methyltransferase
MDKNRFKKGRRASFHEKGPISPVQGPGRPLENAIVRLNALFEALKASPRRINKIFIQKERGHHRIGEIIREARESGIPCIFVPKQKLDQVAGRHQGAVAFLSPREFSSIEEILSGAKTPLIVLLDEVEDPQNLGAIVRTAECAGVDGLILPEHRSAGLTETVATVAAGALEHLKVARVVNLARTMEELKSRGIWLIGAEGGKPESYYQFDYTVPVGIVLGSEGKGLRPLVKKHCDKILSIPLSGRITSLNVASAAAVFLFEAVRQRILARKPEPGGR